MANIPLSQQLLRDFNCANRAPNCNFEMSISYRDWLIQQITVLEKLASQTQQERPNTSGPSVDG